LLKKITNMIAKDKRNRFYRLPNDLIIYIYMFDGTYKDKFNNCIFQMQKIFNVNRINDRLLCEKQVFEIYNMKFHLNANIYGYKCNYSEYILNRIKQFGDNMSNENLKYHKLIKLN